MVVSGACLADHADDAAVATSIPPSPTSALVSADRFTRRNSHRRGSDAAPSATPTATITSTNTPFSHVYLIVMENKSYDDIVGNSSAPYINSLIATYGLATNYSGVAHPSEPNYLALFSGSTQGVTDDGTYNFDGQNLADQLEAHGKTWQVFAQNVPLNCATGATATGGEDGTGTYARKHEPAISFTDIRTAPARCSHITDFTHFDPAAADFEFIAPNCATTCTTARRPRATLSCAISCQRS